ncbi:hypothetical protein WJX74_004219 [Apatococcus lobatus]|uniref:ABC transporter domain-containing protein n=1 Tax=Apatococcus lobatus TaxID=904363 RepID=A0AAW1RCW0_9CHLO
MRNSADLPSRRRRAWKSTSLQLLQTIIFIFFIWVINKAVERSYQRGSQYKTAPHPTAARLAQIPDCTSNQYLRKDANCFDFAYSPANSTLVQKLVGSIQSNNEPPIPASRVLGLTTSAQVDAYLLANPGRIPAAINFNTTSSQIVAYTLQTNSTTQWFKGKYLNPNTYIQLPLQNAAEREIARSLASNPGLSWNVSLADFAHPAAKAPSAGIMAVLQALVISAAAAAFQLAFIKHNSFGLVILLLLLVNLAMMAFGFFVSTIVRKAASTISLGFGIFIVAWILLLVIGFGVPYHSSYNVALQIVFSLFPWSLLAKGIQDLATAAAGSGQQQGISWGHRYAYCLGADDAVAASVSGYWYTGCVLPLPNLYLIAAAQCVVYFLLAVYLDNVIADANGIGQPLWYFLMPSYWSPRKETSSLAAQKALKACQLEMSHRQLDADVQQEEARQHAACSTWILQHGVISGDSARKEAATAEAGVRLPASLPLSHLPDAMGSATVELVSPRIKPESGTPLQDFKPDNCPDGFQVIAGAALPPVTFTETSFDAEVSHDSIDAKQHSSDPSVTAEISNAVRQPRSRQQCEIQPATPLTTAPLPDIVGDDGLALKEDATPGAIPVSAAPAGMTLAEGNGSAEGVEGETAAVQIFGLQKWFRHAAWWQIWRRRHIAHAVRGVWLGIEQGACTCVLGPNAAGKTTMIQCLTGALPASGGEVLILGQSNQTAAGLAHARAAMGVCPQFDILFGALTGREHLLLFAAIKGIPRQQQAQEASRLLEQVKLTGAADQRADRYSGGMQRRLTVAIALIGRPKVIFMDEPTTGMDPVSRRHVWELVTELKRTAAVILTTHSMEEADILGDRVAIMARGRLRAIGTPIHLKQQYGAGYSVSIAVQDHKGELQASDPQLQLAPLEDVFLTVVRKAELENSHEHGQVMRLVITEEHITLKVPVGAPTIQSPSGRVYDVLWRQADDGTLQIRDYKIALPGFD